MWEGPGGAWVVHDGSSPTQDDASTRALNCTRKRQKCTAKVPALYSAPLRTGGQRPRPPRSSPDRPRQPESDGAESGHSEASLETSPAPHPCQAQAHRGSPVLPWALARAPRGPARPDPRLGPGAWGRVGEREVACGVRRACGGVAFGITCIHLACNSSLAHLSHVITHATYSYNLI